MLKIRKNDIVLVIAGKDKGKTGKVLKVLPAQSRAIVEGINMVKKAARKTREDQQGGIIHRENPMSMSNLMVSCPKCSRPTRIGATKLADGTKARICKKCQEILQ
jgi:large subunit ribosomal protein L24